jgi:hypothetical protein
VDNKFFAGTALGGLIASIGTLLFQHYMVIKPLMDMLDQCRLGK